MKGYTKFLFIGVLLFTVVFGLYFASKQGFLEGTFLEKYDFEKLNLLNQENLEQTKVLTSKAQETGEHIQKVLGDSVEVDEDEKKPIHEKTVEYARYLYCKQVVENWEKE